jgi:ubiquinone/menaquinone biosynthesis C-methylase UbiE
MKAQTTICKICRRSFVPKKWVVDKFIYCPFCHTAWPKRLEKEGYTQNYYQAKSGLMSKFFYPLWKLFYLRRNLYIKRPKIEKWIDVGAGDGDYLTFVKSKVKIGVEISLSGRKIMTQKGICSMSDKEFVTSQNLNADVISFWHVLEHTKNPGKYLSVAKKNLKKNGQIIVGLPNIDSFEFYLTRNSWFHIQPGYHEYLFSEKTIQTLLGQFNYKIIKTDYWSIEHHPTGILQSMFSFSGGSLNLLHKLIKREMRKNSVSVKDFFLIVFWTTFGLPLMLLLWIVQSLLHKSGTIVVVASLKR